MESSMHSNKFFPAVTLSTQGLITLALCLFLTISQASAASDPGVGSGAPGVASALFGISRAPDGKLPTRRSSPFSAIGIGVHAGINGVGIDVATPLARKYNLRLGADLFSYSDTFVEEGANIDVKLHLLSGHAAVDWFPFGGSFRISPLVTFANNNRARGTALIPSGSSITLDGSDYISSLTDPLHGSGSVDFRKTAPGLSAGFGNLVPRSRKHFSFPIEVGFYYVGQPTLKVDFTGSACDPSVSASIGCQSVDTDAGFQKSLTGFRARNNNNLKYATFYPIFSTGIGYTF